MKSCPFCSQDEARAVCIASESKKPAAVVVCALCGARGPAYESDSEVDAVELACRAWDHRGELLRTKTEKARAN